MSASYIADLEQVYKEVAKWCEDAIREIIHVLAPDGRPFGMAAKSEEEQLMEYLSIRGNSEKWLQWIVSNADFITQKLREGGVAEDKILSVHPYDLAVRLAYSWSAEMEEKLGRVIEILNKPIDEVGNKEPASRLSEV